MIPDIFKAYDIRGLVGKELTKDFAFSVGAAFAKYLEQVREPSTVVIGEDIRPTSPELASAKRDRFSGRVRYCNRLYLVLRRCQSIGPCTNRCLQ